MADPITQVGPLNLRLDLGRELTLAEGDANMKILRDFSNMLAVWVQSLVKDDGTLQDDAVAEATAIANRIITADKLDLSAINYYEDSGSEDNIYRVDLGGPGGSDLRLADLPGVTSGKSLLIWLYAKRGNTGASYIQIAKGDGVYLDNVRIRKGDNSELLSGDIKAEELVCLVYEPTTKTFRLIGGVGSGGNTTVVNNDINFTGLTEYVSDSQGKDLAGSGTTHTFTHALSETPAHIQVYLENTSGDANYTAGDRIPIDQFWDGTLRSFSVQWNSSSIVVEELPNTPSVLNRTTGALTPITPGSWKLYAKAWTHKSVATITFPELQFGFRGAAFGHSEKFYGWNYSRDGDTSRFYQVDLKTRAMLRIPLSIAAGSGIDMDPTRRLYQAGTVWRKTDGTDHLLVNDDQGWYQILLESPWTTKLVGTGANYNYRPCWLDETALGLTANPDTYAILGGLQQASTGITMRKMVYDGAVYALSAHGANLNLQHANIVNVAAFIEACGDQDPYIFSVQYNPHNDKRRLYVSDRATNGLHVFTLAGSVPAVSNDLKAWWVVANRETFLEYEKTLILPTIGYATYHPQWVKMSVEFNFDTGEEIAIWTSSNHNEEGTVTRTPWVE